MNVPQFGCIDTMTMNAGPKEQSPDLAFCGHNNTQYGEHNHLTLCKSF